jgi:bifunctional non-homologous end joining protein LigD
MAAGASAGIFVASFKQGEIGPGLVSKRKDRPYQAGRSKYWIKIKNREHPALERVMDSCR